VGEPEPYPTAKGVEDAIKAAARRAFAADPSLTTDERIRLEHFNRFLSRVFSEGTDSEWLLKGGTGLLARVPSARATLDIDLYREGYGLDEAVEDLRRLAARDLGDHFRLSTPDTGRSWPAASSPTRRAAASPSTRTWARKRRVASASTSPPARR
jgi:hypothetical protein